jgi:para-nitrobenzyl esterase
MIPGGVFMRKTLSLLALASLAAFGAINDPVRLDSGPVSGAAGKDPAVRVYKGIPFAAPPVGNLRWSPPRPVAHWDGVRSATEFGNMCMQAAGGGRGKGKAENAGPRVSEDCLYLNVWTAAASPSERRPVMVWIHPGGYNSGSGSGPGYDGEALAKKGVVLVTINYRLGIFGFFSHPELTQESDRRGAGNFAFMDQTAALEWVQRNIAQFGGDPKRVTVFGNSAGASSISNLVASPRTKGLFQRAASQSGAWLGLSVGPMRTLAQAEEAGVKTAESILGKEGAHSIAELRAKPADEVLRAGRGGGPVIDGWFLPQDPATIFAQGKQNDVPMLLGSNKDEGTFFLQTTTAAAFTERERKRFGDSADGFFKVYPNGTDAEADSSQFAAFRDELGFVMRNWANAQTKTGKSRVYLYYFTHEPPSAGAGARGSGATHGSEAQYVFGNLLGNRPWTDVDREVSATMSSYWVNFATTGDPNGKGLPKWPSYDAKKSDRPMVLGDKAEVGPEPNAGQIAFFQAWYEKLHTR